LYFFIKSKFSTASPALSSASTRLNINSFSIFLFSGSFIFSRSEKIFLASSVFSFPALPRILLNSFTASLKVFPSLLFISIKSKFLIPSPALFSAITRLNIISFISCLSSGFILSSLAKISLASALFSFPRVLSISEKSSEASFRTLSLFLFSFTNLKFSIPSAIVSSAPIKPNIRPFSSSLSLSSAVFASSPKISLASIVFPFPTLFKISRNSTVASLRVFSSMGCPFMNSKSPFASTDPFSPSIRPDIIFSFSLSQVRREKAVPSGPPRTSPPIPPTTAPIAIPGIPAPGKIIPAPAAAPTPKPIRAPLTLILSSLTVSSTESGARADIKEPSPEDFMLLSLSPIERKSVSFVPPIKTSSVTFFSDFCGATPLFKIPAFISELIFIIYLPF